MIDRKRKGRKISAPKQEKAPSPAPDLMAALERSLAEATGKARKEKNGGKASKGELGKLSREELYERAQAQDVPGRSSMTKDDLVKALS